MIVQTRTISVILTIPQQQLAAVRGPMRGGAHLPVEAFDRDKQTVLHRHRQRRGAHVGRQRLFRTAIPLARSGGTLADRPDATRRPDRRTRGMMIGTHILVGHDGSRDADTAFEDALDLAWRIFGELAPLRALVRW